MKIRDLMEREVATLDFTDRLDLADDIMRLGRIRHLPVLDGERLVGILSQRDLFRAAVSSLLQLRRTTEREWLAAIPITAVMTSSVVTVTPEAPLRRAVALMLEHRIGCLPVVEGDRLVGIVTLDDIAVRTGNLEVAQQMTADVARAAFPEFYFHQRGG
jgi:CBS domain-containing protein